ncbi:MAG: Uncharacterized protein CEN91_195 [Candidatus Berkelbacteria bacterium Licking1014_85]|uniref:Uncharacterized protein n=1 Tax=Candidatus Berkelbacteria bacterium Licking1014_85 TaxID=2017148 RepID=A0A554LL41_9BACT|nr:MAG: Uncharacterized protein CEN91_195 [Candidatus Berkelbacteria bacterium Licking1014_85]
MLLTNKNTTETGIQKRTIERTITIGPLTLKFITLLIFAALTLFYLAQSTQSATKKYELRELKLTQEKLETDKQMLESEALRLKSLKTIEPQIKDLNLVPVDKTNQ